MIPPIDLFQRWKINIVGSLLITEDRNYYMIVAVDYFSKWLEARPLRYVNTTSVATFIYEEIICQYELSAIIQNDQSTHFINQVIE